MKFNDFDRTVDRVMNEPTPQGWGGGGRSLPAFFRPIFEPRLNRTPRPLPPEMQAALDALAKGDEERRRASLAAAFKPPAPTHLPRPGCNGGWMGGDQ